VFKQVMTGLFAISAVAMLWTAANAQECPFNFSYCFAIGGSVICGCYNEGSLDVLGRITGIQGPVKLNAAVTGNVPTASSGPCDFNSKCCLSGTLQCGANGIDTPTILCPPNTAPFPSVPDFQVRHVGALPLTAKDNENCKSGPCTLSAEIDIQNCRGTGNCCSDCCPAGTKGVTFTPDNFDATVEYSFPGNKSVPSQVTVKSADCSLVGGTSLCATNDCTPSSSCQPCESNQESGDCIVPPPCEYCY
jgi:hypothetical protein